MAPHVVIVGGGLAGLSAGCYARASGLDATIVEHNLALGGVCTAWTRGPYTIDGCIHWLTGGAFSHIYDELGITRAVALRPIQRFCTYREAQAGFSVDVTSSLQALASDLVALAPEDRDEVLGLLDAAARIAEIPAPVDAPAELMTLRNRLSALWELRHEFDTLVRFRKSVGEWAAEHLQNRRLRRLLTRLVPPEAPALFLLMILGYLSRGWLSRPTGGTAAFRDALVDGYHRLGGQTRLHSTVDEVLVRSDRAVGVRLGDGTEIEADDVICTSSAPETVLRLLGGRFSADETRGRLERWKLFQPIVLASFGVALPLEGEPQLLLVDGLAPFSIGGYPNDLLYLRLCNDDPVFAPPGHAVVQAILPTDYGWWATRGTRYGAEKDEAARLALEQIDRQLPGVAGAVRVTDVATPLTYWTMARSWRGAYEGWIPTPEAFFGHIDKRLRGLGGFYMAGQWVEPGGGVPTALASGRQAVQLLCAESGRTFVPLRAGEIME